MKTYYFKVDGVQYQTERGSCYNCAFEDNNTACIESASVTSCGVAEYHWIKSPSQESQQPKQASIMQDTKDTHSIKSPYPQVYVIMDKTDNSKSWQFKGPRVYIKYEEAKERCDAMNRYAKGKPHIVVGFELENGCEVEYA